jgi:alpha-mannosidase
VVEAAQQFDAQPFVKQLRTLPEALPRRFSMLRLSPGFLQMTALKKSEDERYVCLRFYNPKQRSVSAHLQGDVSVQHVFRARADETPLSELPVTSADSGFAIELTAEAAEIVTLLIEPAPAAE